MAPKSPAFIALLLALNILPFTVVSFCGTCPGPTPKTPKPKPTPSPSGGGKCPMDTLKLGVCANGLNDLINLNIGNVSKKPCCPLLQGLVDLDAAVCLCTALKANVLVINLNLPIDLNLLLNFCGKKVPKGFQCS